MNEETQDIKAPDFEGEEMKMPENIEFQGSNQSNSSLLSAPILLTLGLLLLVILGGMYYWFNTLEEPDTIVIKNIESLSPAENSEPETTDVEAQADAIRVTSDSDELSDIEADLEATNFENLDMELKAIDAELDASAEQ